MSINILVIYISINGNNFVQSYEIHVSILRFSQIIGHVIWIRLLLIFENNMWRNTVIDLRPRD